MEPITTLGTILKTEQPRDAIHIAIAPVIAAEKLYPSQHVALVGTEAWASVPADKIGVVDPFLRGDVKKGQRFWMFLYPGSIRGLRHEWTHPAFSADPVKAQSEEWLQKLAEQIGLPYSDLIEAGHSASRGESGWVGDDSASDKMNNEVKNEFFDHFEIVTGKKVMSDVRDNAYFSCAC